MDHYASWITEGIPTEREAIGRAVAGKVDTTLTDSAAAAETARQERRELALRAAGRVERRRATFYAGRGR